MKKLLLPLALLAAFSANAQDDSAKSNAYAGFSMSVLNYDSDVLADDVNVGAVIGTLGYQINDNFNIEARYGVDLGGDAIEFRDVDSDTELTVDSVMGLYAIGRLPNSTLFTPYGVLGFSKTKVDVKGTFEGAEVDVDDNESGLSYGLGVEIMPNEKDRVYLEYMVLSDEDDVEATGISMGFTFGF